MKVRQWLAWLVAAVILLVMGGPAFADDGGFSDLEHVPWASGAVLQLATEGVITGVAPGRFDPTAPVTGAQLAVAVARLMGHERESHVHLPGVPGWAAGAVAYLQAAGAWPSDVQPNQPVTRAQVAEILVAAAGLQSQAAAVNAGQVLSKFSDGSQVPAAAQAAVAFLVEQGVLQGSGGALSPNAPVTRAELAVMLANLQTLVAVGATPRAVEGVITAVYSGSTVSQAVYGTLVLRTEDHGTLSLPLAQGVRVLLDGKAATVAQLQPNDRATAVMGPASEVVLVAAENRSGHEGEHKDRNKEQKDQEGQSKEHGGQTVTAEGTVTAVRDHGHKFWLQTTDGTVIEVKVKESAAVTLDGQSATRRDIQVGDHAAVTGRLAEYGIKAESVDLTSGTGSPTGGSGQGSGAPAGGNGTPGQSSSGGQPTAGSVSGVLVARHDHVLLVQTAQGSAVVPVADGAAVTVNGQPAHLDELRPGDQVQVSLGADGTAIGVSATASGTAPHSDHGDQGGGD